MKKLFLAMIILAAVGLVPAVAEQNTHFKPGSLVAQAGVSFNGVMAGVEGGADLSLGQVLLDPVFPLDYGVAARGGLILGSKIILGAGGYGVAHYSLKALKTKSPIVDAIETSLGLGLDVKLGTSNLLNIGFLHTWAYHIDKQLAVELGLYSIAGGTIGVTYKLN